MRHLLAVLGCFLASPAFAGAVYADANAIPPPPYLMAPVAILLLFVAIFAVAAWSLAHFVQMSGRPRRSRLFPRF